jgi:hypothetical protein
MRTLSLKHYISFIDQEDKFMNNDWNHFNTILTNDCFIL